MVYIQSWQKVCHKMKKITIFHYLFVKLFILNFEKLPTFMAISGCTTFQHDGSPVHTAKKVSKWLADSNIQLLGDWPGNSPDLNVIENFWTILKKKVSQKAPTSYEDLKKAVMQVWTAEITPEYCQNLVQSMPKRIAMVLNNKGYTCKY